MKPTREPRYRVLPVLPFHCGALHTHKYTHTPTTTVRMISLVTCFLQQQKKNHQKKENNPVPWRGRDHLKGALHSLCILSILSLSLSLATTGDHGVPVR